MEKVECYKTSDGELFMCHINAEHHENVIEFDEWYEGSPLLGNYAGSQVDLDEMKSFLYNNKEIICKLLEVQG